MRALFRRVRYWMDRRRRDAELREELEFHRTMAQERLERSGMPATDAAHASHRALGNVTLALEDAHESWGWPSIEQIWRDARHGVRILRAQPSFAATAIVTLAAGIGATVAAFAIVDAELLRPLPFPSPERLVTVRPTGPSPRASAEAVSGADFIDWRLQNRSLESVAAFRWSTRHILLGGSQAESVRGMAVSADFFTVLGRVPTLGRSFSAHDERSTPVVVLSDAGWRRLFAADSSIVGRTIALDDRPHVVIGVSSPPRLEFTDEPDLFRLIDLSGRTTSDRGVREFQVIGRLQESIERARAEADLKAIAERLARDYPGVNAGRSVRVDDLQTAYTRWNWRPLSLFLGAAVVLLLLSCVNVAYLLLARAIDRRREFAIRGALGGGRRALLRQLFVEGSLVAAPAAGLGLLAAAWILALVPAWLPTGYLSRGGDLILDARVLCFAMTVTSVTAIAFGLAPLVFAGRTDLAPMLAQSGRGIAGSRNERRARHALVVAEITMALVLVVAAGLFLNSFIRLSAQPLGFEVANRLTLRVAIAGARYEEPAQIHAFSESLLGAIRAVPGVRDAAIGNNMPLESAFSTFFIPSTGPRPAPGEEPRALIRAVTPSYFETLGIRRIAGRAFTSQDAGGRPRVAVINQRLADRVFPDRNPLGQSLELLSRASLPWLQAGPVEIVGVVSNIKDVGMNEVDFDNVYLPFAQSPTLSLAVIVSTAVSHARVVEPVRDAVRHADPGLPVVNIETMEQRVAGALRTDRFNMVLAAVFAAFAVVLAAVGLYAAMAHAVAQRTQEFGVRLALGADRAGILGLAMGQMIRLGAAGTVLGLALALALARVLGDALYLVQGQHSGLIYGVSLADPLTLAAAAIFLLLVATLAGLIPARRATLVDPIVALRAQ